MASARSRAPVFLVTSAIWIMAAAAAGAPLRLGTNVWPGYGPLYLARAVGDLDESQVRLVQFRSATQVTNALRTGSIEAGAVTLDEAIALSAGGTDLTIVQVLDSSNGGDSVVGGPGVNTLSDLVGKRVGVEGTALGAYLLLRALESAGLTLQQISIVPLKPGDHARAIAEDRADAVVCFEPDRGTLLRSGGTDLFNSTRIPGEILDVVVVRTAVLPEHRDAVPRLRAAWDAALKRMAREPEESYRIMGRRMGLDAAGARDAFAGLSLVTNELSAEMLAPGGAVSVNMGRMRDLLVRERLAAWGELPRLEAVPSGGKEGR